MQKWAMFILFGIACLLAAGLMLFNMPKPAVEEKAPEGMKLLKIQAKDDFTFVLSETEVKVGEPVRIKLTNQSSTQHGLDIKNTDISLQDGKMEVDYTFEKAGEYEIVCNVMCGTGHATMKTVLVVK